MPSALNFVVYKELKRQLQIKQAGLSADKVIDIIQDIPQIEIYLPNTYESYKNPLILTEKQKVVAKLFGF